jgi:hypothetical protein
MQHPKAHFSCIIILPLPLLNTAHMTVKDGNISQGQQD